MKHRSIPSDSRILFFTTSPRSPHKILPEVKLLIENFEGRPWDKKTQTEYMKSLVQSDFFEGEGPKKNLDLAARDRVNRAPQLLGFVNLENALQRTPIYDKAQSGVRLNELFLRQLLKFQLPSPLKPQNEGSPKVFWVRPYLEILRLVSELGYLSRDELAIFGMQLTDWHKFDEVKRKVITFRNAKKNRDRSAQSYSQFIQEYITNETLIAFADVINKGDLTIREQKGADIDLGKFIETKSSNMYDYADACRRYLRITGLIAIDIKTRTISIPPARMEDVSWILNNIPRDPVFVDDIDEYQNYLFDVALPALPSDNVSNLVSRLKALGAYTSGDEIKTVDALKDTYASALEKNTKNEIKKEEDKLKTYAVYDDIMNVFRSLSDRATPDKPLLLEWNTWRAMTMIDHGFIDGNFTRDMNGLPEDTAGPGVPDIICHYKDFDLIIEVTMQSGRRQYNSEGEPVADHVGRHRIQSGKPTYCLFIAPTLNENVITYFYGIDQISMRNYGGKSQIIPMSLTVFEKLVERSNASTTKPNSDDLKEFLDKTLAEIETASDETKWYQAIEHRASTWLSASI